MAFWNKLFGVGESTGDSFELIKQNLDDGIAVMLDVRSNEERATVFLKNSIFISITDVKSIEQNTTEVAGLPKEKIVYCH